MAYLDKTMPLAIKTVAYGFYRGFNPVVSISSKVLVSCLVIGLIAFPTGSENMLAALKKVTLQLFGVWYIYLLAAFPVLCFGLALLPASGRIVLGQPGDTPEHSTKSWLAMMFCAGIGVGILVFSVSEPISHFIQSPDTIDETVVALSPDALTSSLSFVFLHWRFSAWGTYAVVGLGLGLACHRFGHPMTMRSALAQIFGRCLEGPIGHVVDIVAIMAIIAGMTTTIVLGVEQICSGLSALTGSPFFADNSGNPPLIALFTALVVAIAVAMASVISGIDRGVKWISNFGMLLTFTVLAIFLIFGSGFHLVEVFFRATATYLSSLPKLALTVYDPAASEAATAQDAWQSVWTIFYWAWWIAFAPFVGLFLARISKGRTVREFILGAVLGPTLMCFFWFSVIGGSAILMELDGTARGRIIDAAHAFRIYETIESMLSPGFAMAVKALLATLFLVLVVASSTAAIIAIKSIGAAGGMTAETPLHSMIWALFIAAIAGSVMAVGGVGSVRDVMVVGAVPFSGIMALMAVSVVAMIVRAAKSDQSERNRRAQPKPRVLLRDSAGRSIQNMGDRNLADEIATKGPNTERRA
jgi:choline-glycine betaine transporter